MQDIQKFHKERFDAKTTQVERILLVLMWVCVVAAVFVGIFATTSPRPYSEILDVDPLARPACQMVCPGPSLAGVCTVKKIPWRYPYKCVPSNY